MPTSSSCVRPSSTAIERFARWMRAVEVDEADADRCVVERVAEGFLRFVERGFLRPCAR